MKNHSGRANRLAPDGSLHAVAARGLMWGNRGALLDARGELARARAVSAAMPTTSVSPTPGVRRSPATGPPLAELPDGTVVEHDGRCWLVLGLSVLPWSFDGYGSAAPRASLPATVTVRTPAPTVDALRAGYSVGLHPSAEPGSGRGGTVRAAVVG